MESSSPSENELAERFLADAKFPWFQHFRLAGDIHTPGPNSIPWLLELSGLREHFPGKTVLDIGTANGGLAFEAERAGATRVLAVDEMDPDEFGFNSTRKFLNSKVEYLQTSLYELPDQVDTQFDIVVFWGVLYHLRHPLLGLDCVARMARDLVSIETVVADSMLDETSPRSVSMFFRQKELNNDATSWFAPTVRCLEDWVRSSGLKPIEVNSTWPDPSPMRAMMTARALSGPPEFEKISPERLLRVARIERTRRRTGRRRWRRKIGTTRCSSS